MLSDDLTQKWQNAGYSDVTAQRAKADLKKDNRIKYVPTGSKKERVWHVQLVTPEAPKFEELSEETPVPFELPGEALDGDMLPVEEINLFT